MLFLKDRTLRKKSPTNPDKKEQHQNRKSKDELIHRWENDDWEKQYKDYLEYGTQSEFRSE